MFGAAGGVNIRWVGLRFPPRVYAVPGELLVKIAPRAGPGQGYEGHKSSLLQLLTIPPSSPAHFGTTNNQSHITNLKYQTTMEMQMKKKVVCKNWTTILVSEKIIQNLLEPGWVGCVPF